MLGKIYQLLFPPDDDSAVVSDSRMISVATVGKSSVGIDWDAITDIQILKTAISTDYLSLVWIVRSRNAELSFTSHTPGAEDAMRRIYNLSNFDADLYYHALDSGRGDPISIYRAK